MTSDDLKSMLMEFTLPPELIAVTVNTLSKVDSLEYGVLRHRLQINVSVIVVCNYTLLNVHARNIKKYCLQLCDSQADDTATARQLSKQWFVELLLASDQYLSALILNERPDSGKCML